MPTNAPVKSTRPSTARNPYDVVLGRIAGGNFAAVSSDGSRRYRVERVGNVWQCSCASFSHRGQCCHIAAAQLDRCDWCLSTTSVQRYENGWEGLGAEISLCDACLTSLIPDCCAEHRSGCNGRHERHA